MFFGYHPHLRHLRHFVIIIIVIIIIVTIILRGSGEVPAPTLTRLVFELLPRDPPGEAFLDKILKTERTKEEE